MSSYSSKPRSPIIMAVAQVDSSQTFRRHSQGCEMQYIRVSNRVVFLTLLTGLFLSMVCFTHIGLTDPWFQLNENQILYLYSTTAQVVAGVYGLTLASYIFFRGELAREAKEDLTLKEPVESLESKYFLQLTVITALVMATILASCLVIADESIELTATLTYMMNIGQSFFAIAFLAIAFFVVDIIQPGNIQAASKGLQNKIDPVKEERTEENWLKFLSYYRLIEKSLAEALLEIEKTKGKDSSANNKRTSNTEIAELLYRRKIIPQELSKRIRALIMLRHAIMHGGEAMVSQSMVKEAEAAFAEVQKALKVGQN
jgi:uncharacterized protein YutE (UPF0331/DUF86 family)